MLQLKHQTIQVTNEKKASKIKSPLLKDLHDSEDEEITNDYYNHWKTVTHRKKSTIPLTTMKRTKKM